MTTINLKLQWILPLMAMFLISIIFNVLILMNSNKFGTIDIQKLINAEAQKLASIYSNGDVPPEKLQALIENIRSNIQGFTQSKRIVLFAKGAVLSENLPDYTENLVKMLEEQPSE